MLDISNFFQKFLNLELSVRAKQKIIIETIKEITNIELKNDHFELKENYLKLKVNPVFRNEIFMYKAQIEESLRLKKIFISVL